MSTDLMYVTKKGSTWSVPELVDDYAKAGDYNTMKIDNDGLPTIVHNNHVDVIITKGSSIPEPDISVAIPSSGYAKINFDLIGDGAGQSRIIFKLKENNQNLYIFKVTDDTYGGSGYTQGIIKKVGGAITDIYTVTGTVALGGTETGNNVDPINEPVIMEVWWSPTNLRLDVNGTTMADIATNNTTALNPASFSFISYRFNASWNSIELY